MTASLSKKYRPIPAQRILFRFAKFLGRELDDTIENTIVISKRTFRSIRSNPYYNFITSFSSLPLFFL